MDSAILVSDIRGRSLLPWTRLAWALLASLLLHLLVVGDIGHWWRWWQPFAPASAPSALDVELLPPVTPARQLPPVADEQASVPAEPQPESEQPTDAQITNAAPTTETGFTAEPARVPRDPATELTPAPDLSANQQSDDPVQQRLPPNGKLTYQFYWGKSRWLAGQAVHEWVIRRDGYTLTSTVSTTGIFQLIHPVKLVEVSQGKITGTTLRPLAFTTQLNEYPAAVSMFLWDKGQLRWFRGQASFTQTLPENSYDKISYLYQLYLAPQKEKYFSAEITMGRRLEHYDILNLGIEDIEIDGKPHQAVHLKRAVAAPDAEQVDIWLSTAMGHLPLKMTYANQAGDHFEQLITSGALPAQ